jgi:pimeloyl-ACP methyl ester carboxylesterase
MRATGLISLGGRPPLWREARIGLEVAALLRDPVFRGDGMVDGRGRPVLLVPGFLAGDGSLSMMAGWLKRAGYRPSRAGIVSNVNCAGTLLPRLEGRLERLVSEQGQRAAIVGQSRGGTLAKVLAHRRPDLVTGVVALGSPQIDPLAVHPLVRLQVEAVGRLGSLGAPGLFKRSCIGGDCCSSFWEDLAKPLPRGIGLVSVYSKSDGVVDWHSCLDPHATRLVEIHASHCGMAVSRSAWRAVAEALEGFRAAEARRRTGTGAQARRLRAA